MKLGRVQVTFVLAKYSEKDSLNDSIVNLCNTYPPTKKILNDSVQYVKGSMILSIPSILNSLIANTIVVKLMKILLPSS